ncbi:hypothetical protein E1B28_006967 [Marasmius oreades]|uniref:F-box domain-containing protein n=1 Tax=Marasmius oreades TaxID=181124 RepID=A0A9P7S0Y3_9AGAR|nr:uncharacterized protein E1B28_006967 [Marasmius oreades]KAG7093285.1 hypothetical protein E1B28_006967 [Marasmius oreades]
MVEMLELKDVLENGKRELKHYEEDTAVLRQTLGTAARCKECCGEHDQAMLGYFSKQRRVPVEIWEMIFSMVRLSFCEYSFNDDYCEDSPLLGPPTTIISQVCSHWRTIATALPKLWSSINVDLSTGVFPATSKSWRVGST